MDAERADIHDPGRYPFEPRNLSRRFETRCAKAGVRPITVHDMRPTCATLLAALDVHPRVAMRILHHAQIDVTMNVYTEVSDAKTPLPTWAVACDLGRGGRI
jgi:integrase